MKDLIKRILYQFKPYDFPVELKLHLGYIFHTEQFYDQEIYEKLLRFCIQYQTITGKKAITTIMSGVNARVLKGCQAHGVSFKEYADRARAISEVSTLGYHGHYWVDPLRTEKPDLQMRDENFSLPAYLKQFEADQKWFQEHRLDHHGIYSAGWWFMNQAVVNQLIQSGFILDFSFSYSENFRNPYSISKLRKSGISVGEPFILQAGSQSLLCVQNFIGCHPTPFFGDFKRNFLKLVKGERDLIGVVNSHDYDLSEHSTLMCIDALSKQKAVIFLSAEELIQVSRNKNLKRLPSDSEE